MLKNTTKAKLKAGQATFGFRMDFNAPSVVESLGGSGFDFVYFDLEHSPVSEESCLEMIRAAEMAGLTPLARVPVGGSGVAQSLLDSGVMGIIVPHCNTKQETIDAVEMVKFPPEGQRGIAGRSLSLSKISVSDYVQEANRETMVIVMIEEMKAMDNLPDILSVESLDVLFVGRLDLSLSLGIPGKISDRLIEEAVANVITQGRAAGKAVGVGALNVADPDDVIRFRKEGAQFFALNALSILTDAAKNLLKKLEAD
jgi:4-hydroxy-2-oxoheptanedioate aldolase